MTGVCTHSTMRPSLQSLSRMSFRALKAPVFKVSAAAGKLQHGVKLHSSISGFALPSSVLPSQTLAASARRSLLCTSSRIVAAAAATAAPAAADTAAVQLQANSSTNGAGRNRSAPTFQEAIKRLQDYWAAAGCVVWLPHNTEVGAGTMNPATFLRCAKGIPSAIVCHDQQQRWHKQKPSIAKSINSKWQSQAKKYLACIVAAAAAAT